MYMYIYRLNVFQAENSTCRRSSVLGLRELFHPEFWIHMNSKRPRIRIFRSQPPLPTLFSRSFFHWFLLHRKKHVDLLGKGTECNQQMMKTHNDPGICVWKHICVYVFTDNSNIHIHIMFKTCKTCCQMLPAQVLSCSTLFPKGTIVK